MRPISKPLADLHFDVQQIPLADGSVDVVIWQHHGASPHRRWANCASGLVKPR